MPNPRRTTRRTTTPRPRATVAPAASSAAAAVETLPSESGKRVDWKTEYAYVVSDLRNLGIVTVGIFALLFIIGFFI